MSGRVQNGVNDEPGAQEELSQDSISDASYVTQEQSDVVPKKHYVRGSAQYLSGVIPAREEAQEGSEGGEKGLSGGASPSREEESEPDVLTEVHGSLTSSDDESSGDELNLLESRSRNIQRNEEMLRRLGLFHGVEERSRKKRRPMRKRQRKCESIVSEDETQKRGMLLRPPRSDLSYDNLRTTKASYRTVAELESLYPFREAQINKLTALLEAASMETSENGAFVPAPIIVQGANGTGKTAVVRSVVEYVVSRHQTKGAVPAIADTYVDCSALDFPSIDEVLGAIYNEIALKVDGFRKPRESSKEQRFKRKRKPEISKLIAHELLHLPHRVR